MPQISNPRSFSPARWTGFDRAGCRWIVALFAFSSLLTLVACGRSEFSKLEPLPVGDYLRRPGDFLGNTYLLKGRIDSQIKWEEGVGRILAVKVEGSPARLPVFVPIEAGQNLHVGQIYQMRAGIREGGLIYVEALQKF